MVSIKAKRHLACCTLSCPSLHLVLNCSPHPETAFTIPSGNLNESIKGLSAPTSFSYSDLD